LINMDDSDWVAGFDGNALEFDGVDDYVEAVGCKGISGTGGRTTAAWINTAYTATHTSIVQWGRAETGQLWMLYLQDGYAVCAAYNGGVMGTTYIADGNWHHVAAVLEEGESSSVNIQLYVDGVPEGTAINSCTINTADTVNVHVGAWYQYNSSQESYVWHFNGLIDDVRIYDRALSEGGIAKLAQ